MEEFVPRDFAVPRRLETPQFVLEPLGPEHNDQDYDAHALSWVRASHAQLDIALWHAVSEWLASDWPFGSVKYAPRA